MHDMREKSGKGDILIEDIEELENLDALGIHTRRLNAKEIIMPKKVESSYSHSQMEQSNCPEEIMESENPPN